MDEELQTKDSGELIAIFGCVDNPEDELVQIISPLRSVVNILIKWVHKGIILLFSSCKSVFPGYASFLGE